MTQEEFAQRIGVSQNYLSTMEHGKVEIGQYSLTRGRDLENRFSGCSPGNSESCETTYHISHKGLPPRSTTWHHAHKPCGKADKSSELLRPTDSITSRIDSITRSGSSSWIQ